MNKADLNLQYLEDDVFSKLLEECNRLGITKRNILLVTKHIQESNFDVDAFFDFQSKRNSFPKSGRHYNVSYVSLRNNISEEEALVYINNYKANKATSRENFIKKYGKIAGEQKFKEFQSTSRISSSDEWFIDKYGETWKEEKKKSFQSRSKFSKKYWTDRGLSEKDAGAKVREWQKANAGVNREYWIKQGIPEDEVDTIIRKINQTKGNTSRNRKFLQQTYGDGWREKHRKASDEYRQKMEAHGLWIALSLKDELHQYHSLCWRYTRETLSEHDIAGIEERSIHFHLDHRYSIKQGFLDDVSPEIIGSVVNLQMLPVAANCSKQAGCDIAKKDLIKAYLKHEDSFNNS